MKTTIYSLLAAAACGMAFGQTAYTTPVGYNTQVLAPNAFTYLGLTIQFPVVSAGVLDAENASPSTVTDNGVNFVTLLGAPNPATPTPTYVLELDDGTIQEITNWTAAGGLSTPEDITSLVTPGTTTYKLRKAATINDVFGPTNALGLAPDNDFIFTTNNDQIFLINPNGSTTIVIYRPIGEEDPAGWYTSSGLPAGNLPIVYTDGWYIKRIAGSPISLVSSGEVKTKPSSGVLLPNYNYLSGVAPVGLTLDNSGLKNYLSGIYAPFTATISTVDNVQIPTGGGFTICYYLGPGGEDPEGWYTSSGASAGSLSLSGGFLIRNRGATKPYKLNVPTNYLGL